jgi:hypothetical protein
MFNPINESTSYEALLAKEIRGYIQECDYMLDIHSLSGGESLFMFKSDYQDEDIDAFATSM